MTIPAGGVTGGAAGSGAGLTDHSAFIISAPIQNEGIKAGRDVDFQAGDVTSLGNPNLAALGGEGGGFGFLSSQSFGGGSPVLVGLVVAGVVLLAGVYFVYR